MIKTDQETTKFEYSVKVYMHKIFFYPMTNAIILYIMMNYNTPPTYSIFLKNTVYYLTLKSSISQNILSIKEKYELWKYNKEHYLTLYKSHIKII